MQPAGSALESQGHLVTDFKPAGDMGARQSESPEEGQGYDMLAGDSAFADPAQASPLQTCIMVIKVIALNN